MIQIIKIGFRKFIITTNIPEVDNKKISKKLKEIFPKIKFVIIGEY